MLTSKFNHFTRCLVVLAVITVLSHPATGQSLFSHIFDGGDLDFGMAVNQTADGGYALFGQTKSGGEEDRDFYLIRCDEQGEKIWDRIYGTNMFELGISMQETSDQGFIMVGVLISPVDSLVVVKADSDGNEQWTKYFAGSMASNVGRFVQETPEGDFIIIGFTGEFPEEDLLILKIDAAGNELWRRILPRAGRQYGTCIRQTVDGGFIIVGETNHDSTTRQDIYMVRTDAFGDTIWTRQFDAGGREVGFSVDITSAGDFVLVGFSNETDDFIILAGVDDLGQEKFRRFFSSPSSDEAYSVRVTPDGGYIIAGNMGMGEGASHMAAIKTDAIGNLEWDAIYPMGSWSDATSVDLTTDGGYILLGSAFSLVGAEILSDFYLVKLDSLGLTGSFNSPGKMGFVIQPNPVVHEAILTLDDPDQLVDRIDLLDMSGRYLSSYKVQPGISTRIDAGEFMDGMYCLVMFSGEQIIEVAKMVVSR